tara:strand:- start:381 stop:1220 length:840 start_codon:yes stop_codon:yes gene_type:complete
MAYRDYLKRIGSRFDSLFAGISANYNFDLGDEFEIAICQALSEILPTRYGVCRGFVVTANDEIAGDDVIVYDRQFPTLRFLTQGDFSKKEEIPIEAVYAYIEAKHTLRLSDSNSGKANIGKALRQVSAVKSLQRSGVAAGQIDPYFQSPFIVPRSPGWPGTVNQMHGAILARNVVPADAIEARTAFQTAMGEAGEAGLIPPDLVIAGTDLFCLPLITSQVGKPVPLPFLGPEASLGFWHLPGQAFSVGLCAIMYALDTMRLGRFQWDRLLADAVRPPQR